MIGSKQILKADRIRSVYEEVFRPLSTRAARTKGSTDIKGCRKVRLGWGEQIEFTVYIFSSSLSWIRFRNYNPGPAPDPTHWSKDKFSPYLPVCPAIDWLIDCSSVPDPVLVLEPKSRSGSDTPPWGRVGTGSGSDALPHSINQPTTGQAITLKLCDRVCNIHLQGNKLQSINNTPSPLNFTSLFN